MENKKPTLVILAAGIGSRYGGLKQMDTFTLEGDTIIDFSIYDALQAGFGKFVFIIRKSFEKEFKEIFNKKLKGKAEVAYVFQELDSVPEKYQNPERVKPWGTGHALLMAKGVVKENFAIINADDFYGKEAFEMMAKSLMKKDPESYDFNMMAYLLKNTVSDYGFVSRGECQVNEKGYLTDVTERTHIEKINGVLKCKDDSGKLIPINDNTIVSMNFWGFTPKCFEFGNELFEEFLAENNEDLKAEFYIPMIVNEILKSDNASVEILKSDAKWFGVTYKEDKEIVQKAIENLKSNNMYPANLLNTKVDQLKFVFSQFSHDLTFKSYEELASGHINDTYLIKTINDTNFVLQRVNHNVFNDVPGLINNKVLVSQHLQNKLSDLSEEEINRSVLRFVPLKNGDFCYKDSKNNFWNMMFYIKNSVTHEVVKDVEVAYEGGKVIGKFLNLTSDFDTSKLIEVIPKFHEMSFRFSQFKDAIDKASDERLSLAKIYIKQIKGLKDEMHVIQKLKEDGEIKLRVTHNDTKISNVLFDKNNNGMCVIDTDTLMPGIVLYDFGDAIRTICNTAAEDEKNLDLVFFNMEYYKAYEKGFLEKVGKFLTPLEIELLPLGAKTMIFIMALRFLTDFLNGDIYYKTSYLEHNLDRTKNQLKLIDSFSYKLSKWQITSYINN